MSQTKRAICMILFLLLVPSTGCRREPDGDGDADADGDADGDGDGDGDTDADADGDEDDGGWPEACPGIAITTDGVLDLDLHAVRITGSVTLRGAALPNTPGPRGSLVFTGAQTGAVFTVDLGQTGPLTYDVVVPPDTYDVALAANPALCDPEPGHDMPCTGGVLRDDVRLTSDGVLDVDIPSVHVSGAVTVNDEPMPAASGDRGRFVFTEAGGSSVSTAAFGTSGPASYAVNLLPGTYDVSYAANSSLCWGSEPPGVPCTGAVLEGDVALTSDGVLDVDVPAVVIRGAVLIEGAAMPSAAGDRGAVTFTSEAGGLSTPTFGASGAASYAVTLSPGVYDVGYDANEGLCDGRTAPPVPCVDGLVRADTSLTADGVLDVDVGLVTVAGAVTVNGRAMESESSDRGAVTFILEGGGAVTFGLGASGAVSYELALLPGSYDIAFGANAWLCAEGAAPSVPCVSGALQTGRSLTADGVLDLDIPRVTVSGVVTLNGQSFPAEDDERGHLSFTRDDGGAIDTPPSGASGAVTYELALLPGSYDVAWVANPWLCVADEVPLAPCMSGTLRPGVSLTSDGVLDVDVPSVQVEGAVTLDGEAMPAASGDRGWLLFVTAEGAAAATSRSLGVSGPASYGISLMPGTFDVVFSANAALCDGRDPPAVPCIGTGLREGVNLTSSGVLDVDVPAVEVTGGVTVNGVQMADEGSDRGVLDFASQGGGAIALPSLGATGAATYGLTVVSGSYAVRHVANPWLCGADRPGGDGVVPCADQWAAGCERP